MQVKIAESWKPILQAEFEKPYFEQLVNFVKKEYQKYTVYPPGGLIFNAFNKCSFEEVKVVIIGQDPYHGTGQANGLCFSVADNIPIPPSLQNIFKEVQDDVGAPIPKTGNLERWAVQGVLLLNAILTVRAKEPGSHQNKGWEIFTDAVIRKISDLKENIVFMLWGKYAQEKGKVIDTNKHFVLKAGHPSPLNRSSNFLGSRHFSQANNYLIAKGFSPIAW
ncbi:MAG: uracil-DNA glycosylase [Microscillaceae bacterium]|nr:uracil-DNA glycosylase [Microscillaceae bacterium]MDW8459894.1 uracil-DNA glycosylase [Cytophagales bacterium]